MLLVSRYRQVLFLLSSQKSTFCPLAEKTINWIEKWLTHFMMGVMSATTAVQCLGEIEQRAPAVGAKL